MAAFRLSPSIEESQDVIFSKPIPADEARRLAPCKLSIREESASLLRTFVPPFAVRPAWVQTMNELPSREPSNTLSAFRVSRQSQADVVADTLMITVAWNRIQRDMLNARDPQYDSDDETTWCTTELCQSPLYSLPFDSRTHNDNTDRPPNIRLRLLRTRHEDSANDRIRSGRWRKARGGRSGTYTADKGGEAGSVGGAFSEGWNCSSTSPMFLYLSTADRTLGVFTATGQAKTKGTCQGGEVKNDLQTFVASVASVILRCPTSLSGVN